MTQQQNAQDKTSASKPRGLSVEKILNGVVLTLIGMSLLAQCFGVLFGWNFGVAPAASPLARALAFMGMAIVPGAFLAFSKCVLNIIRSFKNPRALLTAAGFFLAAISPLISSALMAKKLQPAAPVFVTRDDFESDQFVAGRQRAKEIGATKRSDCPGSEDFMRGCGKFIAEREKQQFDLGFEWAKQNLPVKASLCKGESHFIVGCRTYFHQKLKKPKPAGEGKYEGMTTAECKEEVNANYEVSRRLDIEAGNPQSAAVTYRKHWAPELEDCENYDKLVIDTYMPQAYSRLQTLIDKLEAKAVLSEGEKTEMMADFSKMSKIPDQPYKTAYLKMAEEYFQRLAGDFKEPVVVYPKISCEAYQEKIDAMVALDKERSAAMRALKTAEGHIAEGAKYSALNEARIAMLWDWKLYTDGAAAAGCKVRK